MSSVWGHPEPTTKWRKAIADSPVESLFLGDERLFILQREGLTLNHLVSEVAGFEAGESDTVEHAHVDARLGEQVSF